MVASDTLVGLIGAGILLVALGGVFVVESKDTSVTRDLAIATYHTVVTGNVQRLGPGGTVLTTGQCVPTPPATPPCENPKTIFDVSVAGLPTLLPESTLHYAAFLTSGSQNLFLGELAPAGDAYAKKGTQNVDGRTLDTLVVSLEFSAAPTAPSGLVLYSKKISAASGNAETPQDIGGTAEATLASGKATSRFSDLSNGVQADVTLSGAKGVRAATCTKCGYQAWLSKDAGKSFVYLGNWSVDGATVNGTVSAGVPNQKLSAFDQVVVTLGNIDALHRDATVTPGQFPAFPVMRAVLKDQPTPGGAK